MAKKKTTAKRATTTKDIEQFHKLGSEIAYAIEDSLGDADKLVELLGDVLARYTRARSSRAVSAISRKRRPSS